MQDEDFTDWGVLAAPRQVGRLKTTAALTKFHREGVAGVSPLLVPHLSLHSVSGTVSQVLCSHGPNFGASSGPDHVGEGLLAAVAVLSAGGVPGLWLVLSCWAPDPVPDDHGQCANPAVCHGVALALEPLPADSTVGPGLRVWRGMPGQPAGVRSGEKLPSLAAFLAGKGGASWTCPLDWGWCVELTGTVVPAEARS
jgi:hypothetical protein